MISTERIQPNLVTVADMDAADAIDLIHEAQAYKAGKQAVLTAPAYAVNLFFENSTRTKTSFQMAQMKLDEGTRIRSGHEFSEKGRKPL